MDGELRGLDGWSLVWVTFATLVLTAAGYALGTFWPLFIVLLPFFAITLLFEGALGFVFGLVGRLIWGKPDAVKDIPVQSRGLRQIWLLPFIGMMLGGVVGVFTWMGWI